MRGWRRSRSVESVDLRLQDIENPLELLVDGRDLEEALPLLDSERQARGDDVGNPARVVDPCQCY
jgi:hypothetical protein